MLDLSAVSPTHIEILTYPILPSLSCGKLLKEKEKLG